MCRLTKHVILHLQFIKNFDNRKGIPQRIVNMSNCLSFWNDHRKLYEFSNRGQMAFNYANGFTPMRIDLPTNSFLCSNLKVDSYGKLMIYYLMKDCLIEWMEQRATIQILDLYEDREIIHELEENCKKENQKKIVEFFVICENIQELYRNAMLERKFEFKETNLECLEGTSIIEHLTLLSFESMNDKMRIKLMEYYLESIYRNEMNISDELRVEYCENVHQFSNEGIRISLESENLLKFEFETLEFYQNVAKMKNNQVSIPKFPSIELSLISHERPINLRYLKLSIIGKLDNWCLSNICSKKWLIPFTIPSCFCCWCSTSLCCYKIHNDFNVWPWSECAPLLGCLFRHEHKFLKSLNCDTCCKVLFHNAERQNLKNLYFEGDNFFLDKRDLF